MFNGPCAFQVKVHAHSIFDVGGTTTTLCQDLIVGLIYPLDFITGGSTMLFMQVSK